MRHAALFASRAGLARSPQVWLGLVLLVSVALRIGLAAQGGQYFFGDEHRYDRGVQLYLAVCGGNVREACAIAARPEHMVFTWLAGGIAGLHHALAQLTAFGDWRMHPEQVAFTIWIAAALLSLFSALNIALVHRLVRAAGGTGAEAGWAMLLMAASNAAFYHSRHLLPYEAALSCVLLALTVGLRRPHAVRAFTCGGLAAVGYGLYNGYWFLVPVAWLGYALAMRAEPSRRRLVLLCIAGSVTMLALPIAFGTLVGGEQFWDTLAAFSGSAKQGLVTEGWTLPWAYLWHCENVLGAAVAATACTVAAWHAWRHGTLPPLATLALVLLGAAYGLLVLAANGLHVFVVYGRTVKPLVPFLCVLAGWALAQILARRPPWRPVVAALIVAGAAANFLPHFLRVFPREIELEVLRNFGNPKHTLSVSGSFYIPLTLPVSRPDLALVNAQWLYPVQHYIGYPRGRTLLRFAHPLSYPPFRYEGHLPRERALLGTHDIAIRLIALTDPGSEPDDLPAPLRARP